MVKRAVKRANPNPNYMKNLRPYYPGDPRARENGKKGGRNKGVWALVKMRKKCSKRCPIYDRCPFAYYAQRTPGKPCLLNRLANQEAKTIVKLAEHHEEAIDQAILTYLGLIARDILVKYQDDIRVKRKLLYDLLNVRRTVFGEKKDVEVKADVQVDMEAILKEVKKAVGEEDD